MSSEFAHDAVHVRDKGGHRPGKVTRRIRPGAAFGNPMGGRRLGRFRELRSEGRPRGC